MLKMRVRAIEESRAPTPAGAPPKPDKGSSAFLAGDNHTPTRSHTYMPDPAAGRCEPCASGVPNSVSSRAAAIMPLRLRVFLAVGMSTAYAWSVGAHAWERTRGSACVGAHAWERTRGHAWERTRGSARVGAQAWERTRGI